MRLALSAALIGVALLSGCQSVTTPNPAAAGHDMHGGGAHGATTGSMHAGMHPKGPVGKTAIAEMRNSTGAVIGTARFTEGPMGVLIRIDLQPGSVSPGWHGLHFHAVGNCSDHGAGFMASTGHVGRGDGVTHGLLSLNGPEAGDLPNLYAPEAGPIRAEMFTHFASLGADNLGMHRLALMDADGAALVVHANPDDHTSQPVGNAGGRVACGVLAAG